MKLSAVLLLTACLTGSVCGTTNAAMLDPYQPPQPLEMMRQPTPLQQPAPTATAPPVRAIDESVYEKFRKDTQKISRKERDKLIDTFSRRAQNALKLNNFDVAKYYSRLTEILKQGGRKR